MLSNNKNNNFSLYLSRVKDKTTKKYALQEAVSTKKNIVFENNDDYRNYYNYLIESKQLDVSKLNIYEEILLIKYPKIFYEVQNKINEGWGDTFKKGLDSVKSGIKSGVEAVKSGVKAVGSGIKSGIAFVKSLPTKIKETLTNLSTTIMKSGIDFLRNMFKPVYDSVTKILKNPYIKVILAFLSLAFSILKIPMASSIAIYKILKNGDWKPAGKIVTELGEKIKKLVDASYEAFGPKKKKEIKESKEIDNEKISDKKTYSYYNESIKYEDYYADVRNFLHLNNYIEETLVYNEITGADLPLQGTKAVKDAIAKKSTQVLLYNCMIDGKSYNIVIDLKNNNIGFLNKAIKFDATIAKDFVSNFSGKGTMTGDVYKWAKGEWNIIKNAINKRTFSASISSGSSGSPGSSRSGSFGGSASSSGSSGAGKKSTVVGFMGNQINNSGSGSPVGGSGKGGSGSTNQNSANANNDINFAPVINIGGGAVSSPAPVATGPTPPTPTGTPASTYGFFSWFWSPEALRIYSAIILIILLCMLVYYIINFFQAAAQVASNAASSAATAALENTAKNLADAVVSGSNNNINQIVGDMIDNSTNITQNFTQNIYIVVQEQGLDGLKEIKPPFDPQDLDQIMDFTQEASETLIANSDEAVKGVEAVEQILNA